MDFRKLYNEAKGWVKRNEYHNGLLKVLRGQRSIILIAGHNNASPYHWADSGAVANDTKESIENQHLAYQASVRLNEDGFKAALCPFDLNLRQKIKWVNKNFPSDSVILSIHMNSSYHAGVNGIESWYFSGNAEMKEAAKEAQKILTKYTGMRDRGVKGDLQNRHGQLGILRDTKQTDELLLEMGFITNKSDLKKAREKGAEAIAEVGKMLFYVKH